MKTKLTIISLLFPLFMQAQTWDSLASVPVKLSFPVVVAVNKEIHMMGGGAPGGATTLHLRYRPSLNVWDTLAPVPYQAQQPAGVELNGKIHFFGGGYPNSGSPLSSHYVYNPDSNNWTAKASLPIARVIMVAGVANGKIYALSGQPNKKRVDIYDPINDSWTSGNPLPDDYFWYSALVSSQNKIYRFGGGGYTNPTDAAHVFDYSSNTWTDITGLPKQLHAPAGTAYNNLIFITGGYYKIEQKKCYIYNTITDTYDSLPPLKYGRNYHNMVTIDSCIYVVGGNNIVVDNISTSLQRYCLPINAGIEKEYANPSIIIYPNPAKDDINISAPGMNQLTIYDLAGHCLFTQPFNNNTEIAAQNFRKGLYIFTIENKEGIFHYKIYIE